MLELRQAPSNVLIVRGIARQVRLLLVASERPEAIWPSVL